LRSRLVVLLPLLLLALLCGCPGPVAPRLSAIQERIFTPSCTFSSCHSLEGHEGQLVLVSGRSFAQLVNAPAAQDAAAAAALVRVVPGQPEQSFLVLKLRPHLPAAYGKQMPDASGLLDDDARAAIEEWIRRGANDD
jgi:hypothetical protein